MTSSVLLFFAQVLFWTHSPGRHRTSWQDGTIKNIFKRDSTAAQPSSERQHDPPSQRERNFKSASLPTAIAEEVWADSKPDPLWREASSQCHFWKYNRWTLKTLSSPAKKDHQQTQNTLILFTQPVTNAHRHHHCRRRHRFPCLHISPSTDSVWDFINWFSSNSCRDFQLWQRPFHCGSDVMISMCCVSPLHTWRSGHRGVMNTPAYQWMCSSKRGGGTLCLVVGCLKMKTLNELAVRFDIFSYIQLEWTRTLFFTHPFPSSHPPPFLPRGHLF